MPTLYIMCGIPGSGKTYFARNFLHADVTVSRDKIRFMMLDDNEDYFDKEQEVFKEFVKTIVHHLHYFDTVVADATHLNVWSRKKLTNAIDKYITDYRIVYVVCAPSLQVCLYRNSKRTGRSRVPDAIVKEMADKFQPPVTDAYKLEDSRAVGVWWINGEPK